MVNLIPSPASDAQEPPIGGFCGFQGCGIVKFIRFMPLGQRRNTIDGNLVNLQKRQSLYCLRFPFPAAYWYGGRDGPRDGGI